MDQNKPGSHGVVRGMDLAPRSSLFEGRFGRLFRFLPPAQFELKGEHGTKRAEDELSPQMLSDEDDGDEETEEDGGDGRRQSGRAGGFCIRSRTGSFGSRSPLLA